MRVIYVEVRTHIVIIVVYYTEGIRYICTCIQYNTIQYGTILYTLYV